MGIDAPFLASVDSRCIFISLFHDGRVTNLGERCRDAEDIDLIELSPFTGRKNGESYKNAFLRHRMELPEFKNGQGEFPDKEDEIDSKADQELNAWHDDPRGRELLTPKIRSEITQDITFEQFGATTSSIPYH